MTKSEEVRIGVTVPSVNSVVEVVVSTSRPRACQRPFRAHADAIRRYARTHHRDGQDGRRPLDPSARELSAARHRLRLYRIEHRARARI